MGGSFFYLPPPTFHLPILGCRMWFRHNYSPFSLLEMWFKMPPKRRLSFSSFDFINPNCSSLINLNFLATIIKLSVSFNEPIAIPKNYLRSFNEFLPQPSAILLEIDITDLLNCEVIPNISSFGKVEVIS